MKNLFYNVLEKQEDENLIRNKELLYTDMISNKLDFEKNISMNTITKNKKKRRVLVINRNTREEVVLKYIKKRLDIKFKIEYPNRKLVMRECFSILRSLNKLGGFTIFKFDFENFFETINNEAIYEQYIMNSSLYRYEKKVLRSLSELYSKCYPGLPVTNALIEIVSRDFDKKMKNKFNEYGLIYYSRYVDDGLLIFNENISKDKIDNIMKEIIVDSFKGSEVKVNNNKVQYIPSDIALVTKLDYLGYQFEINTIDNLKIKYGITESKREKYKTKLNRIIKEYIKDGDMEIFRQRILFLVSRVVFYNNFNSKYISIGDWEEIGIISTYCELRWYIKDRSKIIDDTYYFLEDEFKDIMQRNLGYLPYFIKNSTNPYSLKERLIKNKSIVFHPNIGWTQEHLKKQIRKINDIDLDKKSYRTLVKKYCSMIKV